MSAGPDATAPATVRSRARCAALAATLTAALTLTAGCSTSPGTGTTTDRPRSTVSSDRTQSESPATGDSGSSKTGTGEVRHDLDPLTKRFSALGTPLSATWASGTLDGSAPGPSTYWIDAVVELTPETAAGLRDASPTPTTETPDVDAVVRSALPSGQLLRSSDLDALFAQGGFRAKAYLAADSDTVVLVSLGQ